jgi:hypothetical protein
MLNNPNSYRLNKRPRLKTGIPLSKKQSNALTLEANFSDERSQSMAKMNGLSNAQLNSKTHMVPNAN